MMGSVEREACGQEEIQAHQQPEVGNKRIEVGLLTSQTQGKQLMLYLTDRNTQEVEVIAWKHASPLLKKMAQRWGMDPLNLIARYGHDVPMSCHQDPLPPLFEAA